MTFAGKVVAITGAASGIGLATAKVLASSGAKLILADAQEKALQAVEKELTASSSEVLCSVVDVRSRESVEAWILKGVETFGKLDGAAICAGVTGKQIMKDDIQDIDDNDWNFVFDVNVKGTLNTLRAIYATLKDGASVVTMASLAGVTGIPKNGAYVASKHAVVGLSRTATIELGHKNIRVNCVCPGPIETPMISHLRGPGQDAFKQMAPLGRNGQPEEVANLIQWLLSDASSFMSGTTQVIDGGFYNQ